ncbi:MAG: TRAP transporter large permease [Spirochaetaceae bacterium]|nr:TRAP transporter large permease [Spirochaetaceae bacterium]
MDPFAAYMLIGSFLILIAVGVPISFSLGIAAFVTGAYLGIPLMTIFLKVSDGMDVFALLAIPFFILAGSIMAQGGIARRIVEFANILVGWMRGGLSSVNIIASMFFGGISGSSVADTSSIGAIMIPMMEEKGYDKDFAVNVTITSSTQGIIIPPSHNAIIYAWVAGMGVSVKQLFEAGITPGVLVGISLLVVSLIISKKRNYPREKMVSFSEAAKIAWEALWGMGAALIIIVGILGGIATPTEVSAIAAVYAFIVTFFVYRDIPLKAFLPMIAETVKTVAMVMFLIGCSSAFGYLLAYLQIPAAVTNFMLSLTSNKILLLILVNIMLLLLGTIMDMAPLILITTPILLPVMVAIGVNPVHFGIILMLNLGIGLCTPPVGSTLFVGCAIGKISIEEVTKTIWPFYLAMLTVLIIVTYIPAVSMWLPRLLAG